MAEPRPDTERDGSPPGMPRWVKIAALVTGALVLIVVVLQLTGVAGEHGPGRHGLGSSAERAAAPPPRYAGPA